MAILKDSDSKSKPKIHSENIIDLKTASKENIKEKKTWDSNIFEQDIHKRGICLQKSHQDETKLEMKSYMKRQKISCVEPVSEQSCCRLRSFKTEFPSLIDREDAVTHDKEKPKSDSRCNTTDEYVSIGSSSEKKLLAHNKTKKSWRGTWRKKGLAVTFILLGLLVIVSARHCKETDKIAVGISGTPEIGKDLKLQCRRTISGTTRWEKERPNRSRLTYNLHVANRYKHRIAFLETTKIKYDIIIKNATWDDTNATYTCHAGYFCKQIRPVEFYKVLPNNETIINESVYNNEVLKGSLVFQQVYPLPECVLFSNGIRRLVLHICNTCNIWKKFFFKVEFNFTLKLKNTRLSESNITVKCTIGDKEYTYIFPTENVDQAAKEIVEFEFRWVILIAVVGVITIIFGVLYLKLNSCCKIDQYF